ncbi:unnamed protein product [Ilex paraguariensis]|uniref:Uncharacterized protein n=1 Tax=Ilex paraguariensis TaxID=185542 RepID=A0ABC8U8B7_9AQUA
MLCLFLYEPIRKHYKLSSFKLLAFFIQILLIRNLLLFGYQNRIFLCAEEVTRVSCGLKSMSATGVQLHIQDDHVLIGNGVLQITLTNPGGILRGIEYGGIDNLLELHNKDLNGGYRNCVTSALLSSLFPFLLDVQTKFYITTSHRIQKCIAR